MISTLSFMIISPLVQNLMCDTRNMTPRQNSYLFDMNNIDITHCLVDMFQFLHSEVHQIQNSSLYLYHSWCQWHMQLYNLRLQGNYIWVNHTRVFCFLITGMPINRCQIKSISVIPELIFTWFRAHFCLPEVHMNVSNSVYFWYTENEMEIIW